MKLKEIIQAVNEGKIVNWKNEAYRVIKDEDRYLIENINNKNVIGLIWSDGTTINGEEKDFFITVKTFNIILGYIQYPNVGNSIRSQIVQMNYFTDENGFDDEWRKNIDKLNPGVVINNLGNKYDTLIVRLK